MQTEPIGCGKASCSFVWNPDTQEQRYCDVCSKWYHVSCLRFEHSEHQNAIRDQARPDDSLPTSLHDVAYQPISRGGDLHFTAGNIRIVMKARQLVKSGAEREKAKPEGEEWDGANWISFLKEHFGLQEGDDPQEERLLITGQKVYRCRCEALI